MKTDKHFHFDKSRFCGLLKEPSISPSYMQNHPESNFLSQSKKKKKLTHLILYILHYKTLYLKIDKVCFQHVHFRYKGFCLG